MSADTLPDMDRTDWSEWHKGYERPDSGLSDRLDAVRAQIRRFLDQTAPKPVRVISACAGDGRDLLGVLADRTDAQRVDALLVEYDEALAKRGREAARAVPARVEVRHGDASRSDIYVDAAPADLVLLCGIFGNISDEDVHATIQATPQLCAPKAEVIWTRHRGEPDLTTTIREWFADAGFDEVAFIAPADDGLGQWSVGVHRLAESPQSLEIGKAWFSFLR